MPSVQKRPSIVEDLKRIQQRLSTLERASRLSNASIGSGGLRIYEGGDLTIEEGGDVRIRDGGSLTVEQPGYIRTEYPNGNTAMWFGGLQPNPPFEHGFVVWNEEETACFISAEYADGQFYTMVGGDSCYFGVTTDHSNLAYLQFNEDREFSAFAPDQFNISPDFWYMTYPFVSFAGMVTTTSEAANLRIDPGSGLLMRVVSSERYKTDIRPAVIDTEKVLALEPRVFRSKSGAVPPPPPPPTKGFPHEGTPPEPETPPEEPEEVAPEIGPDQIGFIAEEADALGLNAFVEYDSEGLPDGFAYSTFVVAQQAVLRKQQEQIDALTKQVAALTARLDKIG